MPKFIVYHDNSHTVILNAGQPGPNYHALTNEKYFKFAYSSQFGFSIPRGNQLKEEAVMDSMIGVQTIDTEMTASRGGKNILEPAMFFTRNNVSDVVQDNHYVASTWKINNEMQIRTWLIPINGWQLRVHRLNFLQTTITYETGFAVKDDPDNQGFIGNESKGSVYIGPAGFTGVFDITPGKLEQKDAIIHGFPNTNLMTPEMVVLPGITTVFDAGKHWLATAIYAHEDVNYAKQKWQQKPTINISASEIVGRSYDGNEIVKINI